MIEELPKKLTITAEDIEKLLKYQYGSAAYFEPQTTANSVEGSAIDFNVNWKGEHDALAGRLSEVLEENEIMRRDLQIYEQAILKIIGIQPIIYDGELAHSYRMIAYKAFEEVTKERVRES